MKNAVVLVACVTMICATACVVMFLWTKSQLPERSNYSTAEKPPTIDARLQPETTEAAGANAVCKKTTILAEPIEIFNNNGYGARTDYIDLNLSRWVSRQTKGVFLMVRTVNNGGYIICYIRKKGATLPAMKVVSPVQSIENWGTGLVGCDSEQCIQYQVDGFLSGVGAMTIWLTGYVE